MNTRNSLWVALIAVQAFAIAACGASDTGVVSQVSTAPLAAPVSSPDRTYAEPAHRGARGVRPVEIVDAAGFGQPVVAAVAEIPEGWQAEGGVRWNRETNCVTNQLQLAWRATSPDGSEIVEILPGFNWQVQGTAIQMNPCPAMPFATARDFLTAVVEQNRPGARILQYRDRPDLAQPGAQASQNPNVRVHQEAGQILIAYADGGREVRETLGTTVAFSNAGGNVVGGTAMVFAQRAPAGALDFALGDRIAKSLRPNPQWLAMMREAGTQAANRFASDQSVAINDWHNRRMAAISARGAADRAAISANTAREVAAINNATYQNTQGTNERIQAQTLEGIGEYNRYRGIDGGEIRSSIHGGDRVLQMSNGDAFSTSDPYLNPAGSTELERIP